MFRLCRKSDLKGREQVIATAIHALALMKIVD